MTVANPYSAPHAMGQVGGDATYSPQVFSFNGRIGRLRYLAYSLAWGLVVWLVLMIAVGIFAASMAIESSVVTGIATLLMIVAYVGSLVPTFALAVRRLNDVNQSGWLSLLIMVPLVNLVFILYLIFAPGTDGENNYGPAPEANGTGVVIGALIIPVFIALIGILAAIAVPAYNDYLMRAEEASTMEYVE